MTTSRRPTNFLSGCRHAACQFLSVKHWLRKAQHVIGKWSLCYSWLCYFWPGRIAKVFSRTQIGREGEEVAARYLQRNGFRILTKRYRNRFGEIDLVALHANVVVFVEVKTWTQCRSLPISEDPSEAVDLQKQQRLTQAALAFLKQFHLLEHPARFDVVSVVVGNESLDPQIRHFVNAFESVGFGQFFG
ncbi:MAG: YraN family protein [Planctomycetota bacterium]|nr:YraN family protein [Planctomycetota bacterium]MDA1178087.1 YraN family protein [Planctomycetota bacterium]